MNLAPYVASFSEAGKKLLRILIKINLVDR